MPFESQDFGLAGSAGWASTKEKTTVTAVVTGLLLSALEAVMPKRTGNALLRNTGLERSYFGFRKVSRARVIMAAGAGGAP